MANVANEYNVKGQVDMWNDLILHLSQLNMIDKPMFIETHRWLNLILVVRCPCVLDDDT
jgi:hypothetical protein